MLLVQAGAWTCRSPVVICLRGAFGLPAPMPTAGLVIVVARLSTLVPLTPGGAGTQQVMRAYALHQTVAAAAAVSFLLGMQTGITVVNALLGVAFRTPSGRCDGAFGPGRARRPRGRLTTRSVRSCPSHGR